MLAVGNSGLDTNVIKWGGWFGLATAAVAWYASMAAVVNSTFGRTMLPVRWVDKQPGSGRRSLTVLSLSS